MKKFKISIFAFTALFIASCNQPEHKEKVVEKKVIIEKEVEVSEAETEADIEALSQEIDQYRAEVEASVKNIEPVEISTSDLRAKIAQKWSKIHYYLNESGDVIRVKTYPYETISKRTEEFYFKDGQLVLAAVEDNGEGEPGKEKDQIDKLYYYFGDKGFAEERHTSEEEHQIRNSDSEELLVEAEEYLEIYNKANGH